MIAVVVAGALALVGLVVWGGIWLAKHTVGTAPGFVTASSHREKPTNQTIDEFFAELDRDTRPNSPTVR